MEYRGIEFQILQTVPKCWRWQFKCDGIARAGTGFDRNNAVTNAKRAIDIAVQGPCAAEAGALVEPDSDRSSWNVGKRVSRKSGAESGRVVEVNGKIKVKWDSGRTSYFAHDDEANVQPEGE